MTCDTGAMGNVRTSRAVARVQQIDRIKATSRRLMAEKGAPGLSLREVAREMDVVSSALYRYFATRDDLLTALIVDAYNDLGAAAERAAQRIPHDDARRQLHAAASAIRKWAKTNPNEYALLYGSPVPGYEAPPFTVEPAARVALVLGNIVAEAWRRHASEFTDDEARGNASMKGLLETRALDVVMPGVPERVRALSLMVWSQIFGCISFELFGHYKGSVRNAGRFFNIVVDEAANLVLPPN
ncbi:MAG TPA: TetR/AcrR family transcriptional regulator [Acidimicrobiales bacterium]